MRLTTVCILVLLGISLLPGKARAQTATVRGIVRDTLTRDVLPYAHVIQAETRRGVSADAHGRFEFAVGRGSTTLIISHLGYKSQSVFVQGTDTSISVSLTPIAYLLQEVSIYARSTTETDAAVSLSKLQRDQVVHIAGMTKDVLRALETLPSVSVNNEASARFNVRGGTSDENLVLVNGVRVYEPYHLKAEPLASIGIFNVEMVKKIDFVSGGFTAEHGDALSSVLTVDYRAGNTEKVVGKASLSLIDLSVLCEGPASQQASWILGVRKSYLEYMLKYVNANPSAYLAFYDIQGQVDYELAPSNKVRLNFISSGDDFTYDPTTKSSRFWDLTMINGERSTVTRTQAEFREADFHYANNLFSIRSTNLFSARLMNEISLSVSDEFTDEEARSKRETSSIYQGKPQYFFTNAWEATLSERLHVTTSDLNSSFSYQPPPTVFLNA